MLISSKLTLIKRLRCLLALGAIGVIAIAGVGIALAIISLIFIENNYLAIILIGLILSLALSIAYAVYKIIISYYIKLLRLIAGEEKSLFKIIDEPSIELIYQENKYGIIEYLYKINGIEYISYLKLASDKKYRVKLMNKYVIDIEVIE